MKEKIDKYINEANIHSVLEQIEVPEGLEEKLLELNRKENSGRKKRISKWLPAAACFAFVFLVGTASVAAVKKWGFSDFYNKGELPQSAEQITNAEVKKSSTQNRTTDEFGNDARTDIVKGHEDVVSFKPTFTVCDEESVYVGFEAEVSEDSGYFLISEEDDLLKPVSEVLGKKSAKTVLEYCKKKHLNIIMIRGSFPLDDKAASFQTYRAELISGNKVEYLLVGGRLEKEKNIEVSVIYQAFLYQQKTGFFDKIADRIQNVGVPDDSESTTAHYGVKNGEEKRIGKTTIYIREVVLKTTPLATYAEFYVRNDDAKYGNWVSVALVDQNHEFYERGPGGSGEADIPDGNGCFVVRDEYQQFKTLPEKIYVRARNLELEDEETEIGFIELKRKK